MSEEALTKAWWVYSISACSLLLVLAYLSRFHLSRLIPWHVLRYAIWATAFVIIVTPAAVPGTVSSAPAWLIFGFELFVNGFASAWPFLKTVLWLLALTYLMIFAVWWFKYRPGLAAPANDAA